MFIHNQNIGYYFYGKTIFFQTYWISKSKLVFNWSFIIMR